MKIIDCFMYYDEDLVLDIRLNTLNKYVSFFVICEANFNHNGTKRDLFRKGQVEFIKKHNS